MVMEKLNQGSEWPKKEVAQSEKTEEKSEEWPSDYFECLQPVFMLSEEESERRGQNHLELFRGHYDTKELIISLLIYARSQLREEFDLSELTSPEIMSLVAVAKKVASQLGDRESVRNYFSAKGGWGRFDYKNEVVDNWLIEDYSIYSGVYGNISGILYREDRERGVNFGKAVGGLSQRSRQFADYVRKTVEGARIPNKE